jgi:hypothetical protein
MNPEPLFIRLRCPIDDRTVRVRRHRQPWEGMNRHEFVYHGRCSSRLLVVRNAEGNATQLGVPWTPRATDGERAALTLLTLLHKGTPKNAS